MSKKFKKAVVTGVAAATLFTAGGVAGSTLTRGSTNNKDPKYIEYTVKEGDTLYDIANKYYGNGIYYEEIANRNKIEDPDHLVEGTVIRLPKKIGQDIKREKITYTVKEGDNLTTICEKVYGDSSYETALKLAAANNLENADKIAVGQELVIPEYDILITYEVNMKR